MVNEVIKQNNFSNKKWMIVLIILVITLGVIWKIFFSYATCGNWDCFNSHLENCNRVKFVGESNGLVFEYTIKGSSNNLCNINVKLLQGEFNNQDSIKLEHQEMIPLSPFLRVSQ